MTYVNNFSLLFAVDKIGNTVRINNSTQKECWLNAIACALIINTNNTTNHKDMLQCGQVVRAP